MREARAPAELLAFADEAWRGDWAMFDVARCQRCNAVHYFEIANNPHPHGDGLTASELVALRLVIVVDGDRVLHYRGQDRPPTAATG